MLRRTHHGGVDVASRKIVFVNRFFFPDHSATSQMVTDLAVFLAGRGLRVEIVTSPQGYEHPDADLPDAQWHRGILIHRVRTFRFGRESLPGRLLDYLSFYWTAFFRLWRIIRSGDCVIAKTDPPLIAVAAALAARLRGAVLVNWIQDVFPETAFELGVLPRNGLLANVFLSLRNWSLRDTINVVVSESMRDHFARQGIARATLHCISNWADDQAIHPVAARNNPLRMRWKLGEAFVLGYSGNLGRAHEFETVLGAAERLQQHRDVTFLFIGGGALMAPLRDAVAARGLRNFRFKPYQPRKDLGLSLSVPDLHLVVLRPSLEGLVLPSKFFGIAAAGRPILYIGGTDGEVAKLITVAGAGWAITSGDVAGLAARILELRDHPAKCREAGTHARHLLESRFTAERSLTAWAEVLAPWKP